MDRKTSSLIMPSPPCGHGWEMMEAMRRQQEHLMQLRALVLPLVHDSDDGTAVNMAIQLFDDVIGCNCRVVATLEGCLLKSTTGGREPSVQHVDDKSSVRKTKEQARLATQPNSVGQKRRRSGKRSRSFVTHVPYYDGHEWRKYGQKNINGRNHPRSYYRCTYSRERNCLATKTVEQQEQNDSAMAGEENAKFTVVYFGDHTCNEHSVTMVQLPQLVGTMDLQSMEMAQTSTGVQEPEADLDLPALLEVFDSALIDWEDCKM